MRQAAWYQKALPTFSDALAQVGRCPFGGNCFFARQKKTPTSEIAR